MQNESIAVDRYTGQIVATCSSQKYLQFYIFRYLSANNKNIAYLLIDNKPFVAVIHNETFVLIAGEQL
jgi:hypothetical protein